MRRVRYTFDIVLHGWIGMVDTCTIAGSTRRVRNAVETFWAFDPLLTVTKRLDTQTKTVCAPIVWIASIVRIVNADEPFGTGKPRKTTTSGPTNPNAAALQIRSAVLARVLEARITVPARHILVSLAERKRRSGPRHADARTIVAITVGGASDHRPVRLHCHALRSFRTGGDDVVPTQGHTRTETNGRSDQIAIRIVHAEGALGTGIRCANDGRVRRRHTLYSIKQKAVIAVAGIENSVVVVYYGRADPVGPARTELLAGKSRQEDANVQNSSKQIQDPPDQSQHVFPSLVAVAVHLDADRQTIPQSRAARNVGVTQSAWCGSHRTCPRDADDGKRSRPRRRYQHCGCENNHSSGAAHHSCEFSLSRSR